MTTICFMCSAVTFCYEWAKQRCIGSLHKASNYGWHISITHQSLSQPHTHTHTHRIWFVQLSTQRRGLQSVFLPWCLRTFLAFIHTEWMSPPCLGWRAAVPNDWCAIIAIFVNTKHCHITTEIAFGKVSCSWHSAQSSHQECRCAQSMNEVAIK